MGTGGRRFALLLSALCCGAALAACGSSGKPHPNGDGAAAPSLVSFAVCMRSHGLRHFADPGAGPGGGVSIIPAGIDTAAPAFKRAISACNRLLPGLGSHRPPSALATRQLLHFASCMRSHGITGFPDPRSIPPPSREGYSLVVRWGGVFLAVPATINPHSPAYESAASACHFGPIFS